MTSSRAWPATEETGRERPPTRVSPRFGRRHLAVALVAVGLVALGGWKVAASEGGVEITHRDLDGTPISVFARRGLGPAGGPVVVVGHGFAGSRPMMRSFALALAKAGYVAMSFDFPGHGESPVRLDAERGMDGMTETLLGALARVEQHARDAPESDGRVALLGHSMGANLAIRHARASTVAQAVVAVSPSMRSVSTVQGTPRLLFVYGGWEATSWRARARAAVAAGTELAPSEVETERTYGAHADGSTRRLVVVEGVEHLGILYSGTAHRVAVDWIDRAFGRGRDAPVVPKGRNRPKGPKPPKGSNQLEGANQPKGANPPQGSNRPKGLNGPRGQASGRGPGLLLFYLGVVLLAWPLSRLLPRVAEPPVGAGLGWGDLALPAIVPAVATPLLLWPIPTDFLPILVGDYLAVHLALYGMLTLATLALRRNRERQGAISLPHRAAFLIALGAVWVYELGLVVLPTDHWVAAFLPGFNRLGAAAVLFVGAAIWSSADEWLTRGAHSARGAYVVTKALFLLSLLIAVALDPGQLFVLVLALPAILVLFSVFGVLTFWLYGRTGHPLIGALAHALALGLATSATFPVVD